MMSIGIVETKYGKVQGSCGKGEKYAQVTLFNSIPYAAPPVGELRFKPPVKPVAWEGVRDCSGYGGRPWQNIEGMIEPYESDFFFNKDVPAMSEDCLYLSVATAAQSAEEKRPVYMWFHGGGLVQGWYYEPEFDPSEFARKGIVVVSVGQRLGAFGCLSLKQLSDEQGGASGNYTLMDEVAAFEWVRENIAAFGGDPDNITVGGQSGGTWKAGALSTVPAVAATGAIKRVIHQSALYWARGGEIPTMEEAEAAGAEYLKSIGVDVQISVEELRKLPVETFFKAPLFGRMVCDGKYIMYPDQVKNVEEYAADLDYLAGCNYGECRMEPGIFGGNTPNMDAKWVYARAKEMLGELYEEYGFENLVHVTDENAETVSRGLAALGMSEGFFSGVNFVRAFGAYQAKHHPKSRVWSYLFSHIVPSRPEEAGTDRDMARHLVWHSGELWYTFASLRENVPPARAWHELDYKLADQVTDYWANFIKCGDPNGEGLETWPASGEKHGWMDLGDKCVGHEDVEEGVDAMVWEYTKRHAGIPE